MDKISYKINDFEGPLDLLIKLIDKKKINISDIKITVLLEQYMEQISIMRSNNIEVKSEFLEMAARLIYIKTVSLLPNNKEAIDLKSELSDTLNTYQYYKEIALYLSENYTTDYFVRKTETIENCNTYDKHHNSSELINAYINMLIPKPVEKEKKNKKIATIVSKKIVSVFSRVIYVFKKLLHLDPFPYKKLFDCKNSKSSAIATFLAVLELIKNKRIVLVEEDDELQISFNKEKS